MAYEYSRAGIWTVNIQEQGYGMCRVFKGSCVECKYSRTWISNVGRYFILPVPNSVSGTCLCNILRHKVSQHNFHNIHLLNVHSKFRDTEYEVRSPQESPCISIDQIISGQK